MTARPVPATAVAADGTIFRDLDHDGVMAPFEDPRLGAAERAADLAGRLTLEEKAGLLFHAIVETSPDGTLAEGGGRIAERGIREMVLEQGIVHVNVHALPPTARLAARWANAVQALAAEGRFSIPVTISTDPRHSFAENDGAAFSAGAMSAWPEPLGLSALDDPEEVRRFADVARREYRAVGLHAALHPQIDLATEPRWGRQFHTFGPDAERVSRMAEAYLDGFQIGPELGPESVACMAKHFPGGGPQLDGEDPHFPYGREQVYPGGQFELHLEPFRAAIARGVSALMPYYGMPVGLVRNGEAIEEVGFGFNRQVLTGILREELGYEGVICTDWGLLTDTVAMGLPLPARAWGVEHLDLPSRAQKALEAGVDQFGGEQCPEVIVELVRAGRVAEERLDASVRRLLEVKFRLGLFEDPFVDEDAAEQVAGAADFVAAGRAAQAASTTVLADPQGLLPLEGTDRRVFVVGLDAEEAARLGEVVDRPEDADLVIVRLEEPFEPRADLFLEPFFHQGSLEYRPGLVSRLRILAAHAPLIIDATLLRPAILAPVAEVATTLVATYGSGSAALIDALTGAVPPRGTLPFEIPASMDAVRAGLADVPGGTADPLFPVRHGLGARD
ncbi:glycoside hydrolase family 3 protein [Brachybacterium sp. J153]|uniref:glycoside hydrolase family 3 protein n=1 Tax=Brachybacterium sp. J153 TaxID=3116488 RepID=UPI002E76B3AA|nr:glycoside hydrolase family 3 N-terminal domain-containing protein [Brachybacterium sp. J153]MEE1618618.1 glycoside hydrolase family 3 N-terminal domain-containing protein [Brachybacterium sp. J153]